MITMKRKPGRPRLAPKVKKIACVLPVPMLRRIDRYARSRRMNRSAAVRELVGRGR